MYDYANILFTGKCNLGCYECIGNDPSLRGLPSNLSEWPLKGIDDLIAKTNKYNISDLAFTGTNVDPQMYRHEIELIEYIRPRLTGSTRLSLHTNGLLALMKMDIFNSYDKVSVSLHSFKADTYKKMTRAGIRPDIYKIAEQATVPLKLSMLVTGHNIDEIGDYIRKGRDIGIRRIVVRKIKGKENMFPLESMSPFSEHEIVKRVFDWPVYNIGGVEVTVCGFDKSTAKGLFLFSDGHLEDKLV